MLEYVRNEKLTRELRHNREGKAAAEAKTAKAYGRIKIIDGHNTAVLRELDEKKREISVKDAEIRNLREQLAKTTAGAGPKADDRLEKHNVFEALGSSAMRGRITRMGRDIKGPEG